MKKNPMAARLTSGQFKPRRVPNKKRVAAALEAQAQCEAAVENNLDRYLEDCDSCSR